MDPELAAAFKRRREEVPQVHNDHTSVASSKVQEVKKGSAKKDENKKKHRSSNSQHRQSKSDDGKASTNQEQSKSEGTTLAKKEKKNADDRTPKSKKRKSKSTDVKEKPKLNSTSERSKKSDDEKVSTSQVQPKKSEDTETNEKKHTDELVPRSQKRSSKSSNVKANSKRKSANVKTEVVTSKGAQQMLSPVMKKTDSEEKVTRRNEEKEKKIHTVERKTPVVKAKEQAHAKESQSSEHTQPKAFAPKVATSHVQIEKKQSPQRKTTVAKAKELTDVREPKVLHQIQSKAVVPMIAPRKIQKVEKRKVQGQTAVMKSNEQPNTEEPRSQREVQSKQTATQNVTSSQGQKGEISTPGRQTKVVKATGQIDTPRELKSQDQPKAVIKKAATSQQQRVEQKQMISCHRGQTTVVETKEQVETQVHRTQSPHIRVADMDKKPKDTQEKQVNKTVWKEAPQRHVSRIKEGDMVVDEEAPRNKSLEAKCVGKGDDLGYVEEKPTTWNKHKKKFCGSVLLVLLVTLGFLVWSLIQFRKQYAGSERGIGYRGASGGGVGLNDAPSPAAGPSTPQPTIVPPVKTYLREEFGISIESDEAKLAVAQLVDEAKANGGDGEVPLTPKSVQRFALINMDFALAGGMTAISRQSAAVWGQFGQDECEWKGVTCNDNQEVTDILIGRNDLKGTIPSEVGLLQALTQLDLSKNDVYGTIPEELYNCLSLQKIFLYKNRLTGPAISDKIINLWNLTDINVSSNQLTGSIPSTMKSNFRGIFGIRYFNVYNNDMTGSIPENLKLRQLYYMDLGKNKFSGTLPSMAEYIRLRHLFLDQNNFSGAVPESVVNAGDGRLHSLRLNNNQFTGALPGNHKFITELNHYEVQGNDFTSMDSNACKLWVFDGGELVDFKSDCAICNCGNKSTMCQNCSD